MIAHRRITRGPEKEQVTLKQLTKKLQKDPRIKNPGVFVFKEL
jgi:hypothetical protein